MTATIANNTAKNIGGSSTKLIDKSLAVISHVKLAHKYYCGLEEHIYYYNTRVLLIRYLNVV